MGHGLVVVAVAGQVPSHGEYYTMACDCCRLVKAAGLSSLADGAGWILIGSQSL